MTVPKTLAQRYGIRPGDEIVWQAAGDVIRLLPQRAGAATDSVSQRLAIFDQSEARQRRRQRGRGKRKTVNDRGWKREELYERGRAR